LMRINKILLTVLRNFSNMDRVALLLFCDTRTRRSTVHCTVLNSTRNIVLLTVSTILTLISSSRKLTVAPQSAGLYETLYCTYSTVLVASCAQSLMSFFQTHEPRTVSKDFGTLLLLSLIDAFRVSFYCTTYSTVPYCNTILLVFCLCSCFGFRYDTLLVTTRADHYSR
jgi:hypothetical protein